MQRLDLKKVEHSVKVGDPCGFSEPNVTEDVMLYEDGELIGFFIRSLSTYSERAAKLAEVANAELLTDKVPKKTMDRVRLLGDGDYVIHSQFSTTLGSIAPKPHVRRGYPSMSSVHAVESAQTFIKAMLKLCAEAEAVYRFIAPELFERQLEIVTRTVPERWRFGKLFTSSISNFNIAASYHKDVTNIVGCNNIIITKRWRSSGGNLNVPDYGATFDSCDNSMLVYPAWRNIHGVTPIVARENGGYRNSLIFYPLKAFCLKQDAGL